MTVTWAKSSWASSVYSASLDGEGGASGDTAGFKFPGPLYEHQVWQFVQSACGSLAWPVTQDKR